MTTEQQNGPQRLWYGNSRWQSLQNTVYGGFKHTHTGLRDYGFSHSAMRITLEPKEKQIYRRISLEWIVLQYYCTTTCPNVFLITRRPEYGALRDPGYRFILRIRQRINVDMIMIYISGGNAPGSPLRSIAISNPPYNTYRSTGGIRVPKESIRVAIKWLRDSCSENPVSIMYRGHYAWS